MAYDDMKPQSNELVFEAEKLPPLGLKLYYVEQISSNKSDYNVEDISNMYYGTNVSLQWRSYRRARPLQRTLGL